MVLYVDAVVAVTVICVLLFVLHGCMLREWGRMRCGCGQSMSCVWYMYCV